MENNTLCGFLFYHGINDYSLWQVDLNEDDRTKIEEILLKYEDKGVSERNIMNSYDEIRCNKDYILADDEESQCAKCCIYCNEKDKCEYMCDYAKEGHTESEIMENCKYACE